MKEKKDLTWSQAIEKAIIELGYIATLKQIYAVAPNFKEFKGLTPHKTINERVQRDNNLVKLRPGLYGLKNYLDKLPDEYNPNVKKSTEKENAITHSFVQGMLIEIGNIRGFETFAPNKTEIFVNKKLHEISTKQEVPKFTFDKIINKIKHIDVIWFNQRNFPNSVFEIENSTNFRNSLVKFVELQDFVTTMTLIAPNEQSKINKFHNVMEEAAFSSIKQRVKFFNYEYVEKLYNHSIASQQFQSFF